MAGESGKMPAKSGGSSRDRRTTRRATQRFVEDVTEAVMSQIPPAKNSENKRRKRDVGFAALAFLGSLVIGVVLSRALWAAFFLTPTIYFTLDWAATFLERPNATAMRKTVAQVTLTVVLMFFAWHFYLSDLYEGQLASATEGDLIPLPSSSLSEGDPVVIQIGPTGGFLKYSPKHNETEAIRFLSDAGLHLRRGPYGIILSTPVRDRNGNLVADITDNHWRVFPPFVSDKNFTNHALEIKDSGGHVILQVELFPERIMIQGIWEDQYGHGSELVENYISKSSVIQKWPDRADEEHREIPIPPMFSYPSSSHLGQLDEPRPQ